MWILWVIEQTSGRELWFSFGMYALSSRGDLEQRLTLRVPIVARNRDGGALCG